MSREDQVTAALLEAQSAERREFSDEKIRIGQESAALLRGQSAERQEKPRERSHVPIRRVPVGGGHLEGEKGRLERETLAMLEGRSEKNNMTSKMPIRSSTAPPIIEQVEMARDEGMDWDAPPPAYEQSFGDGQQRISTAVLGNFFLFGAGLPSLSTSNSQI